MPDNDAQQEFLGFVNQELQDSAALMEIFLNKPLYTIYQKGQRIRGEYEVRGIFPGGNGVVMTTWNHRHRRSYALKTLREDLLLSNLAVSTFEQECRLWISLGKHPFLIQAYFLPHMSGRLFVAIECIEPDGASRVTLQDHIRGSGGLPLERILPWAIQICLAMEYANRKGVICHRDLKPANVLIDSGGDARVSDFGIAKTNDFALQGRTYLAGTLPYIPPESLDRTARSDSRRDIWSTGVILYEAVSGTQPWFTPSHDPREWTRCIVGHRPRQLPGPLWPVIEKCLKLDRQDRYHSFEAMRHDLEAVYARLNGRRYEAPEVAPETAEDLLNRAFSMQQLHSVDEAIRLYRQALEMNAEPFTEGRIHHNLGRAFVSKGDWQSAEKHLEEATRVDPSLDRPWIDWARMREQDGDSERGRMLLDCARRYGSEFVDVWLASGDISLGAGDACQALQHYEHALQIDPTDSQALFGIAECQFRLERKTEARASLRRSIGSDPRRFGLSMNRCAW